MTPPPPDHRGAPPRPLSNAPAPPPPLRREPSRATAADALDAPFAAARLTALTHELANLLDGSMRCLGLAQRSLIPAPLPTEADAARTAAVSPDLARSINTVHAALAQMAQLVRAAMDGVGPDARLGRRPGLVDAWNLEDALRHAADVMTPVADDAHIALRLTIDPALVGVRCGLIYAPVAAGVRNAIESIQQTGRGLDRGVLGEIHLSARLVRSDASPGGHIVIEITDDGVGPPPLPKGHEALVFELGFSTKAPVRPSARFPAPGAGIGLAMTRDVARSLGGDATLLPRADGRQGATLCITFPMRAASTPAKPPKGTDQC